MRITIKGSVVLAISALFFLTGCATNRSVLNLNLPDAEVAAQQNGKQVFINSISDQRVFQESPKRQDIPSLGFGGAGKSTIDLKKRAVGRKRNSYGKALGDMLLAENQTVETVIRNALKQSFTGVGYSVIEDHDRIDNDTVLVDAEIGKFWAYMTPGFWAITLSSDIFTKLILTNKGANGKSNKEISVKSEGKYQVATENNWMEIIEKALAEYIAKTKEILSSERNIAQQNN